MFLNTLSRIINANINDKVLCVGGVSRLTTQVSSFPTMLLFIYFIYLRLRIVI